jgi:hypothetical protein
VAPLVPSTAAAYTRPPDLADEESSMLALMSHRVAWVRAVAFAVAVIAAPAIPSRAFAAAASGYDTLYPQCGKPVPAGGFAIDVARDVAPTWPAP